MKRKSFVLFLLLTVLCMHTRAQKKDTVVRLSEVEITEKQYVWMNGLRVTYISQDAIRSNHHATLSELLQTHSPVFVKSYGQGSLSTISLRGAGASHTQVLWNGLRINSPMLGQVDFSQQPVFFTDEATLVSGAADMSYGTATAGGSLILKNHADWSLPLRVQVSAGGGSYSALQGSALVRITQDKNQFCTRIMHSLAENDFTYHDNSVASPWPLKTRTDAACSQTSVMQEIYSNLSPQSQLSFHLWGGQHYREIPPSLLVSQPPGNESQTTSFARSALQWKKTTTRGMLHVMIGGTAEDMNYVNKTSSIDSKNRTYNFTSHASYVHDLKNRFSVFGIVRTETERAHSVNYSGNPERTVAGVTAGLRKGVTSWLMTSFCTRTFITPGKTIPFVPTASVVLLLSRKNNLLIRGNWSGIARYPTLNDLYWNPGGNKDLSPESGNTCDAGISFARTLIKQKLRLQAESEIWRSQIHSYIQWLPSDTGSWWTPQGIKDVSARGSDFSLAVTLELGRYTLYGKGAYRHTRSTVTATEGNGDHSLGKQLIYVPEHLFGGNLSLKRGNWTAEYFYQYTGKRFTTSDNLRYMPRYMLSNVSLGRVFSLNTGLLTVVLSSRNLLDTDYQVIAWQPMPGRNYFLSVKYNFNKQKLKYT